MEEKQSKEESALGHEDLSSCDIIEHSPAIDQICDIARQLPSTSTSFVDNGVVVSPACQQILSISQSINEVREIKAIDQILLLAKQLSSSQPSLSLLESTIKEIEKSIDFNSFPAKQLSLAQDVSRPVSKTTPASCLVGVSYPIPDPSCDKYCFCCPLACNSERNLIAHLESKEHKRFLDFKPSAIACLLCHKNFTSSSLLVQHENSYPHFKARWFEDHRPCFEATPLKIDGKFFCPNCPVSFNSEFLFKKHVTSDSHKKFLAFKKTDYCCNLCHLNFNSFKQVVAHNQGKHHLKAKQTFLSRDTANVKPVLQMLASKPSQVSLVEGVSEVAEAVAASTLNLVGSVQSASELQLSKILRVFFSLLGNSCECDACWSELCYGLMNKVNASAIWRKIQLHPVSHPFPTSCSLPSSIVLATSFVSVHFQENINSCCKSHSLRDAFMKTLIGDTALLHLVNKFIGNPECLKTLPELQQKKSYDNYVWTGFSQLCKSCIPGISLSRNDFSEAVNFSRGFNSISQSLEKIIFFFSSLVNNLLSKVSSLVERVPVEVSDWIKKVDAIQVLYKVNDQDNNGYELLSVRMNKDPIFRQEVFDLYRSGIAFSTKFTIINDSSMRHVTEAIKQRQQVLVKVIASNTGSYLGSDRKDKPFLIYLYGKPGVGKTVAVDHIFTDVFSLLWKKEYVPSTHKFSWNPISPYFDTYSYQEVFELQDFMQVRDKGVRITELNNLIKQSDESAYSLNAAFERKGTIFFQSKFIVLTSNLNPVIHKAAIASCIEEPEAFDRRIDLLVEVDRTEDSEFFNKDAMAFNVFSRDRESAIKMDYNHFIAYFCKSYEANLKKSQLITSLTADDLKKRHEAIQTIMQNPPEYPPAELVAGNSLTVNCPQGDNTTCEYCAEFVAKHLPVLKGSYHLTNDHRSTIGFSHDCRKKKCFSKQTRPSIQMAGSLIAGDEESGAESCLLEEEPPLFPSSSNPMIPPGFYCDGKDNYVPKVEMLTDFQKLSIIYHIETLLNDKESFPNTLQDYSNLTGFDFEIFLEGECIYSIYSTLAKSAGVLSVELVPHPSGLLRVSSMQHGKESTLGRLNHFLQRMAVRSKRLLSLLYEKIAYYGKGAWNWMKNLSTKVVHFFQNGVEVGITARIVEVCKKYLIPALIGLGSFCATICYLTTRSIVADPQSCSTEKEGRVRVHHKMKGPRQGPNSSFKFVSAMGQSQAPPLWWDTPKPQMSTESANILMHNVRPNLGIISSPLGTVNCLALSNKIITFTEHLVDNSSDCELKVVFPGSISFAFNINEVDHILCEGNHMWIVNLGVVDRFKRVRDFSDVTRYFIEKETPIPSEGFLLIAANVCSSLVHVVKLATAIKEEPDSIAIGAQSYVLDSALSYDAFTVNGDCGSPLFSVTPNSVSICGFHCAAFPGGRAFAGQVNKQWIKEAVANFSTLQMDQVDTMFTSPVSYPEVEDVAPKFYQPTKNQLMHSPFYDESTCLFAPSALKGKFQGETPASLSFKKSLRPVKYHPPEHFDEERNYLLTLYQTHTYPKNKLTVNEAIFGVDDIKGIQSDASVGWPWSSYTTRKQLIDKNTREVSYELYAALEGIERNLSCSKVPEFVIIDLLKDEKLPKEKVAIGKARTFYILPIDINIILKQYFGRFCQFVVNQHYDKPCKVGLSLKFEDVAKLASYLRLESQEVAYFSGDVEASDRCIPYEVFMVLVDMVNEWYGDEYGEQRYLLGKSIFSGKHSVQGMVYTMNQGIPSGCYLTAVFNSLAYAIIYTKVFSSLQVPLISVASFGDDTVAVFDKRYKVTSHQIQQGFNEYGLVLTAPTKDGDVSITGRDEIVFLQRKFVKRGGVWFMPMHIERVQQHMMWYKKTNETKHWGESQVVAEILHNAFLEFYFHGPTVFNKYLDFYMPSFKKYSLKPFSYDSYKEIYYGLTDQLEVLSDEVNPTFGWFTNSHFSQLQMEPANLVEETVLADAHPVSVTENLTEYVEVRDTKKLDQSFSVSKQLDVEFSWGRDYCKALERWVKVGAFVLNSSQSVDVPTVRVNPLINILNEKYIADRIYKAYGASFDIEVTVRVIATKFHYGQLLAVFRPALYDNQAAHYMNVDLGSAEFVQSDWGPWDSVYTASQIEHQLISLTQSSPTHLTLKWHYPFNWVYTHHEAAYREIRDRALNQILNFCTFDIYSLTGAYPVDLDKPNIVIWTRFKNLKLYGYTDATTSPLHITYTLPTYPGDPIQNPELQAGEYEDLSTTWSYSFKWISDIAGTVVSMIRSFASFLMFLGFSNPRPDSGPKIFSRVALPTATSCGPSPAISCSFRSDDHQVSLLTEEKKREMLIASIGEKEMLVDLFIFSNNNRVASRNLSMRNAFRTVKLGKVFHPAAFVSTFFQLVRSSIRVKMYFSASAVIAARVLVSASPLMTDVSPSLYKVSKLIDITGDVVEHLELPYFEPTQYHHLGTQWFLSMELQSDIVSAEETEDRPVLCTLWLSYPGLEVAIPTMPDIPGHGAGAKGALALGTTLRRNPVLQAKPPMMGNFVNGEIYGLNCSPTSLLHVMKRISTIYETNASADLLELAPARTLTIKETTVKAFNGPLHVYMWMFKYINGGFNIFSVPLDTVLSVSEAYSGLSNIDRTAALAPAPYRVEAATTPGGFITPITPHSLIHVPYRAPTSFCFVENVIFGDFEGTTEKFSYPGYVYQYPVSTTLKRVAISAADDFEMWAFVGTPAVDIIDI